MKKKHCQDRDINTKKKNHRIIICSVPLSVYVLEYNTLLHILILSVCVQSPYFNGEGLYSDHKAIKYNTKIRAVTWISRKLSNKTPSIREAAIKKRGKIRQTSERKREIKIKQTHTKTNTESIAGARAIEIKTRTLRLEST